MEKHPCEARRGAAASACAVIDQALGILIGQNGYNHEEAFDSLRVLSQGSNRKLGHVAEEIVKHAVSRPKSDPGAPDAPGAPNSPEMSPC